MRKNDPRSFKWLSNALVAARTLSAHSDNAPVLVWRDADRQHHITLGGTEAQRKQAVATVTAH